MVAPGCTKRLPLSGSTRPAAIFSSVDLPEPLRPIRQTRSDGDTLSSTPASNGAPPKVRWISLSWTSGGAIASGSACGRLLAATLKAADGLVEGRQEGGTVARR